MRKRSEEARIPTKTLSIKIIAIGPVGSGKTSIIRRYVHGHFQQHYKATIGVEFCRKAGKLPHTDIGVDINLWDLAGDDRFGAVSSIYFRKARGVFVVFDLSRPQTVEAALKWYNVLSDYYEDEERPPVVFLANKTDLEKRANYQEIRKLVAADEHLPLEEKKALSVVETSAKDDVGIHSAVEQLLSAIESRLDLTALDDQTQASSAQAPKLDDSCCSH